MKVRLTQQVQGSRDGQDWPAPGAVVDLPDHEAQGLISGGAAVDAAGYKADTVLVPPMGVHTPGRVAMPVDAAAPLVEAPVDALADPAAARRAVEAARDGDFIEGPGGIAHQDRTGLAKSQEALDRSEKAEHATREALGVRPADVVADDSAHDFGQSDARQPAKTPAKAQPAKTEKP